VSQKLVTLERRAIGSIGISTYLRYFAAAFDGGSNNEQIDDKYNGFAIIDTELVVGFIYAFGLFLVFSMLFLCLRF
jgi:hypothetical protein